MRGMSGYSKTLSTSQNVQDAHLHSAGAIIIILGGHLVLRKTGSEQQRDSRSEPEDWYPQSVGRGSVKLVALNLGFLADSDSQAASMKFS
jgi:hypothetical protein